MSRPKYTKSEWWILFPDIHHPDYNKAAFRAALSCTERNKDKVKGVILTGDNMDCVNISRHTEGKPRLRTRGGIVKDFTNFNRDILLPIENVIASGTKKVFFHGNHEDWVEQWLDKNPEFEGLLSFDHCLNLSQRGWEIVKQGDHYEVGKAYVVHGDQIGSSMHVAKKLVESFSATAVMGHVHQYSAFTKTSYVKATDKWIGITLPTLGTIAPKYAKGRPNAFLNGFGIIEKWPNGFVNIYVPIIFNGMFSFGGEIYSGV
jgi:hypothetical protein